MANQTKIDLKLLIPQDAASQEILQARSKVMASVAILDSHESGSKISYIKFLSENQELYGIPYYDIQDIKGVKSITRIPKSPAYIAGISYWHGKIIPIIDLANYFNISTTPLDALTCIIATTAIDGILIGYAFKDIIGVDDYVHEDLEKNLLANDKIKDIFVHGIHHGNTAILNINQISHAISAELMNKEVKTHGKI